MTSIIGFQQYNESNILIFREIFKNGTVRDFGMLNGLKMDSVSSWLKTDVVVGEDKRYRHNLITEDYTKRGDILETLKGLIRTAHDDARFKLREFLRDDLDPLEEWDEAEDPAEGYPEVLDLTTLKGYFGEFFSGLVAENFAPFEESNWRVPLFPFRFHNTAFDQLEVYHQTGQIKNATYGRTGDDCVAFVLDGHVITKILFLEAKCTATHDSTAITAAHKKISSQNLKPVELKRLVDALKAYRQNTDVVEWIVALRNLYRSNSGFERFDCVSYVCGSTPKNSRKSWISRQTPHSFYTGGRKLEAVEVHLTAVNELVRLVYGKEEQTFGGEQRNT